MNFACLVFVVERQIRVFLEHSNFTHSLWTDPARSDVGDTTVLETNSRVGNIFAFAQHWHAHGVNALDGGAHEMQNDFQIVDHQIKHDPDIGAAVGIRGKAVRFDETRMRQSRFKRAQYRIESLDVSDLQNQSVPAGQFRELSGILRIFRDRFLDQ